MSSNGEAVNTESDLEQLRPLLAKQHDHYREMLQEPIDNSISATVQNETYYDNPEPFTIQLDFERTPDACKVIVADAGHGMSREVIRDFVFSTGDTNYSNGILNNIGAGLKASICWCEESLQSAQGVSTFDNRFHVLSKEPEANTTQRVDGPIGGGLTVYESDDEELWNEGASELPHQDYGTRVHLTCAVENFNNGVASVADQLSTKMRYIQEELGVKFQHLLQAHDGNRIVITFRDINEEGEIKEQDAYEVVPISPKFKAKPSDADVGEITDYDSYDEFVEALDALDESRFGGEQYGYKSTKFEFEETGETFYVSYEYGELDLEAMIEAVDAGERDLLVTSPQTDGFRWRYKWNKDGTGVDIYGNGRILDAAEWVFDLNWNNQYNGYCGMVRIFPAEPTQYEIPTTNDKTGIEKGSALYQKLVEWLNSDEFKPVATYQEGAQSGDDQVTEDDDDDDTEETDDDSDGEGGDEIDEDGGTSEDGDRESGASGNDDGKLTESDTERGSGTPDDDEGDGADSPTSGSTGTAGSGDDGGGSQGESGTTGGGTIEIGEEDGDKEDTDDQLTIVRNELLEEGAEQVDANVEAQGIKIHLVSKYSGADNLLHLVIDGMADPETVYRAMLYQDHYKRLDRPYGGTQIWAADVTEPAKRDLKKLDDRRDEHGDQYGIEMKLYD